MDDPLRLKQQLQSGDFSETRQYLARSRKAHDWQDRCFLLNLLAPSLPIDALTAASDAEPNAADLLLLLGAYYFQRVGQSRGTKTAELTTGEQFGGAEIHLQNMMECLLRVYELDRDDPTPHIFALRGLVVFTEHHSAVKQEYAEAIRLAPDCVPAHFAMVNARSQKWGGSHEESLAIARAAMRSGKLGGDMPVCLFVAHFFVWQYARNFNKNKVEAEQYIKDPTVNQELNQALERWIGGSYLMSRSSVPYLHQAALWYYLSGDYTRLQRILRIIGNIPCDQVWKQIGDPAKTYSAALQKTPTPVPVKKAGFLDWFKR